MGRAPSYDTILDTVRAMGPGWHLTHDVLARLEAQGYDTSVDQLAGWLNHLYRHEERLERRNEDGGRRAMWRAS